jgi:hypothetical protein
VLSYLMHRRTPVERLLVVWQLGTGKTIGMLRVLDQYFDDPRPKLLLFPTDAVASNFYEELARHPNRFRSALEHARRTRPALKLPETPDEDDQPAVRAQFVERTRWFLSLWPKRMFGKEEYNGLPAPMRAFTYAELGRTKDLDNALFRSERTGPSGRTYDRQHVAADRMCHMILLCDRGTQCGAHGAAPSVTRRTISWCRHPPWMRRRCVNVHGPSPRRGRAWRCSSRRPRSYTGATPRARCGACWTW